MSIGLALTIAGFGLSAIQSVQQAQAQRQMFEYQAKVARANQEIQNRAAQDIIDRGAIDARLRRQEVNQLIGTQRAALAANGVIVDVGSARDLTLDTAGIGALEVENIKANAERAAYERRVQGFNFGTQAQLANIRAANTSALPGIASALTSAGSIATRFGLFRSGTSVPSASGSLRFGPGFTASGLPTTGIY